MFLASFLILTYDLSKAPFIQFVFGFIFVTVLIKGKLKLGTLVRFGIIGVFALFIFYAVLLDNQDLFSLNKGPLGRIFLGQAMGTYFSFYLFPYKYPHIGFSSISNYISNIFDMEHSERAGRYIME